MTKERESPTKPHAGPCHYVRVDTLTLRCDSCKEPHRVLLALPVHKDLLDLPLRE
mgnify:CR=1 FL=1